MPALPFPRLAVLAATLIVLPASTAAQATTPDPGSRQYDRAALTEDFALLRRALEEAHAGLYRYSPKPVMDSVFDAAAARLHGPMTEREFLAVVTPVIGAIHDGHTGITPSEALTAYLDARPTILPFDLWFRDGRAYVAAAYTDPPAIPPGSEVLAVNGRTVSQILDALLPSIPSDGRGVTGKYRRALDRSVAFSQLHAMTFGVTTEFSVTHRSGTGAPVETAVDGMTRAAFRQYAEDHPPAEAGSPPIDLTWHGDVPVLTVRTFSGGVYRRAGIDYPQFLADAFGAIAARGSTHLVVDVRGNGGGTDEYGKLLAAHLLSAPFEYYAALEINAPSFSFMAHTNQPQWTMAADRVRRNAQGRYDVLGHPNLGLQQPVAPTFAGEVTILIDGGSFSATGEFTSVVHHAGRATFVGEESGAGYYGNTSGGGATLTLPHTGVRVRIPFIRYTCAASGYTPADRGLRPDHEIVPTIGDRLAGRDPVLAFALERAARE